MFLNKIKTNFNKKKKSKHKSDHFPPLDETLFCSWPDSLAHKSPCVLATVYLSSLPGHAPFVLELLAVLQMYIKFYNSKLLHICSLSLKALSPP